jgi:hypothetical protein
MALEQKLPFRLEEANSFFNGGAQDVSDTMASALWALDYLYWWASHGAAGINFHTGDKVAAGEDNAVCRYAAFTSVEDGYAARPIAYALKAFDLGSHGKLVPVKISPNDRTPNLSAYATSEGGRISVTLINKETAPGHDATVSIQSGNYSYKIKGTRLTCLGDDIAATSGIKLGNAEIAHDGVWRGAVQIDSNEFSVPAGTAAVVDLFQPK